jgi:hypothetical protein
MSDELARGWKDLLAQIKQPAKRRPGRRPKPEPSVSEASNFLAGFEQHAEAGLRRDTKAHLDFLIRRTVFGEEPKESRQMFLALPILLWDRLEARQRTTGWTVNEQLAGAVMTLALILTLPDRGRMTQFLEGLRRRHRRYDAAFQREARRIRISASRHVWMTLDGYAGKEDIGLFIGRLLSGAIKTGEAISIRRLDRTNGVEYRSGEEVLNEGVGDAVWDTLHGHIERT